MLPRFVAVYCLFDSFQIVLVGTIKGAGDTWFVLANTTATSLLAVLIGWIGSHFSGGRLMLSLVVTEWIVALGISNLARFLQGRWWNM